MDIPGKIQLDDNHYVEVIYDEHNNSPRNWDNISKLCIREHRRYNFPNELNINFEDLNSDDEYSDTETIGQHENKKLEGYHVFNLDCYEHSSIHFSLSGTGMQCQFDTARKCWIIAVPKHIEWDNGPWYIGSKDYTEDEAREMAKADIEIYNQYLNGEIYGFSLYQTFASVTIEDRDYKADDEYIDWCWWFYDKKDISEHLPKEYREKFLSSI